ncbi:helix-turn-helix domain-containing protein [Bacillus cytotoxicus]|uniref:Helix-turn-helix domain-containing protein n=1 Tax=Bacillus cytotoxicus TaxID=580165 RepID=A0ACC6A7N1_9BACI|nr:helix-turn-helix domain-containing protein [Bacillus cytotoxicus]
MVQIDADKLRKIRVVNKLTQAEMGVICGVTESMINKVERNAYPITDKINEAINREFQLDERALSAVLTEYGRIVERKARLSLVGS